MLTCDKCSTQYDELIPYERTLGLFNFCPTCLPLVITKLKEWLIA